jgi:hypothetical protein
MEQSVMLKFHSTCFAVPTTYVLVKDDLVPPGQRGGNPVFRFRFRMRAVDLDLRVVKVRHLLDILLFVPYGLSRNPLHCQPSRIKGMKLKDES